jgi:hypothetical protein
LIIAISATRLVTWWLSGDYRNTGQFLSHNFGGSQRRYRHRQEQQEQGMNFYRAKKQEHSIILYFLGLYIRLCEFRTFTTEHGGMEMEFVAALEKIRQFADHFIHLVDQWPNVSLSENGSLTIPPPTAAV